MKTLLITLLLIFGMKSYGQQIKFANHPMDSIGRVWTRGNNYDTLFIEPGKYLKFIKIGEHVYKIESPTLTEVKDQSIKWDETSLGSWYGSVDTARVDKYFIAEPYHKPSFPKQP